MTMNHERSNCPLCGGNKFGLEQPCSSNADGHISGLSTLQCLTCSVRLTNPVPSYNEVSRYYSEGIYAESASGGKAISIIDRFLDSFADVRLREIRSFDVSDGDRLLDIGCGKGRFLSRALHSGYEVIGTDTASVQADVANDRYGIEVRQGEVWEAGFQENMFDVITSWHVLEHLLEPARVVDEVARILKPSGLFVCEVPNIGSLQSAIGEMHWFQLDVPRHLNHYTPESMSAFLVRHGFEIVKLSTFGVELSFFGMLQSILNRIGLPPNSLFQWLKRSKKHTFPVIIANICLLPFAIPAAIILEILASTTNRGGVVRIVARLT